MPNQVAGARAKAEAAEKLDRKIHVWLREHLIPQLAGVFGEKCSNSSGAGDVECTVTRPRGSFYLSDLFFASIRLPGAKSERRILVKLPAQDSELQTTLNFDALFANEILFYKRVLDRDSQDYPKCYLAGQDPVFKDVIVLEDVCQRGFFVSTKKVNVQLDYIVAGLQSMARFHGNTYAMKEQTPEKFYQIENHIVKIRYNKGPASKLFQRELNLRIRRVTKGLRVRGYDLEFTNKIADLFEDCFSNVMMKCVEPIEPLATIIHGDCTINNILFRKMNSSKCGDLEAMLVDFAMMMYSSPAIDVSTFVYMCCSRESIKEHSEDLFKAYYDCLSLYLKDQGVWDPAKYSRDAFWRDYKQRAIFGYVMDTFFLPMMTEYESNNDVLEQDHEAIREVNLIGGGESLTNLLVDMLIDMREAGLLDYYLNDIDNAGKHDVCSG